MKKQTLLLAVLVLIGFGFTANAQPTNLHKQALVSKAMSTPIPLVTNLVRHLNVKNKPAVEIKSRGDVYGADYSDVIIDNWSGYYVDIYVNGNYRGTCAPYDKRVTWAIPGQNTLYAKAVFDDGSYVYWGPQTTVTGYEYTWKLNPL